MLFYIIIGITGLNKSFYIIFAVISSKIYIDYYYILYYFQKCYIEDNILNTIFAGTNYEKVLIKALKIIFS